jgi:hypothetical protein
MGASDPWSITSFPQPSSSKKRLMARSCTAVRRPTTPYQRLLVSDTVAFGVKETLMATYRSFNPARIAKDLHDLQEALATKAVMHTIP